MVHVFSGRNLLNPAFYEQFGTYTLKKGLDGFFLNDNCWKLIVKNVSGGGS
jgi:hypothetical protein